MYHPAANIPGGETPNQAIPIDTDTDTTTDSDDGGMQLDPPELMSPLVRSGSLENVIGGELYDHQIFNRSDSESVHSEPRVRMMSHTATLRHDARARNRIREEKNAALAVLTNWELLMTYALANGESIPMTRRRFTAKLIAPGDTAKQEDLVAERWLVPSEDGLNLVSGRRRLVVDFDDDSGWRGPRKPRSAAASRSASRSTSGSASVGRSPANSSHRNKGVGMSRSASADVQNYSSPLLQQQQLSPAMGQWDRRRGRSDDELGDEML